MRHPSIIPSLVLSAASMMAAEPTGVLPNIIMIITDQQRADTIAALGARHMITPNLDRLVAHGTSFTHAYSAGATCIASRAALFTGMWPHNTGVYSFNHWGHHYTWVQDLRDKGYHTVNLGKMHCSPLYSPNGFDERRVVENTCNQWLRNGGADDEWGKALDMAGIIRPIRQETVPGWRGMLNSLAWEYDDKLHVDAFVGDMATSWIGHWPEKRPLFLEIGFVGPHEPYTPPQRCLDLYQGRSVPPAQYRDGEFFTKPPQIEAHQEHFLLTTDEESVIDLRTATPEMIDRMRRHYFASITHIDEKIGSILGQLERKGILSNSIVIFTSDHGDNLGDHRLPYKWVMSEPVVNIPLVIADFRRPPAPRRDASLVSQIDLGPTILEWAGLTAPTFCDGRSLAAAISDGRDAGGDRVHCEDNYQIMVRTKDSKLVYYIDQPYGEYYDLAADPHELDNLWDRSERRAERDVLLMELLGWHTRSVYFNSPYKEGKSRTTNMRWPEDPRFDAKLHRTTTAVPRPPGARLTAPKDGGPGRPTP